jgi:hypothetical protein
VGHKGANNHVLDPPAVARSISGKKYKKHERATSQEESFILTMTYAFQLFDQCFTL